MPLLAQIVSVIQAAVVLANVRTTGVTAIVPRDSP